MSLGHPLDHVRGDCGVVDVSGNARPSHAGKREGKGPAGGVNEELNIQKRTDSVTRPIFDGV